MRYDAAGVCAAPVPGEVHPMMPIEHQVCSYALAQRLAELGVRQESVCWWVDRKVTYTANPATTSLPPVGT